MFLYRHWFAIAASLRRNHFIGIPFICGGFYYGSNATAEGLTAAKINYLRSNF
jgi:hypothetical protein